MIALLVVLLVLLVVAGVMWRRGARLIATALAVLALLPGWALLQRLSWPVLVFAAVVAAVAVWLRWGRTAATVTRWGARARRKAGVASPIDILRGASGLAMRRKAATVRPSLSGLSRWERWRLPVVEVGVLLCRTGWLRVWAAVEDVVVAFGGPRVGKSAWLAGRIIDAPGAALVTSTRTDLYEVTHELRARRGPVFVFNAVGLAGLPSTVTFDPLTGCTDPITAAERATDLLAAGARGGSGDREYWEAQARRVLAALLHAAALGGRLMRDVLAWVADPERAGREVVALLRKSSEPAFEQDVLQFVTTNERTRTSITSTIMPALGWLTSPAASAAAAPGRSLDVGEVLRSRATLYLLGAEETQAAPLVTALTGHIAREARRLAAFQPAGRLDPPLGLFLDEAALISPVPLQSWTADMGGRGVSIVACFQSRAQLLARYGEHDAATILNNTGAVLVFGGTRDRADLEFWSTLAGERDENVLTTDLHGRVASRSVRKVPVLAPGQIANLPAGQVVVIRRGLAPVIGRAEAVWRRADVRELARARRWAAGELTWLQTQAARRAWLGRLHTMGVQLSAAVRGWVARHRWERQDLVGAVWSAPVVVAGQVVRERCSFCGNLVEAVEVAGRAAGVVICRGCDVAADPALPEGSAGQSAGGG
ncbi:type IV secretory system conjugative DNA transfer family protein [Pseudonocardia humida]|nr:TraM recognition domain-containing protein [Pseudonocardia humida]